jgi:hypothetical protein
VFGAAVTVAAVHAGASPRSADSQNAAGSGAARFTAIGNGAVGNGGALALPRTVRSASQRDSAARGNLAARAADVISAGLTGFAIPASRDIREPPPDPAMAASAPASPAAGARTSPAGTPPRQLIVPDVIAAAPAGVTLAQLAKIRKLAGVRAVLAVDGGQVTVNGKAANVIGVAPQAFRSWTPPQTAASVSAWTDLGHGDLLASRSAVSKLGLKAGTAYPVDGAAEVIAPLGAAVPLSIPGVDAVVDGQRSAQLGLIKNVAVLINAPGADLTALMSQVRSVIGPGGKVVNLVPVVVVSKLPVTPVSVPAGQVPSNYLALYKASAAMYCPGLSWTVLAAIGEIESGNGANVGPSSAGALGPMQFLPSTWAAWGIDGFGRTGPPDIMNPLDAVPSAARMLCADGAAHGSAGLSGAIFDYNHATWYVNEVLQLATEYAQAYG